MLLCSRTVTAATSLIPSATLTGTTPALAVVQAQDSDGYTPLMEAAAHGHLAVAKQLLRARADTALVDKVCSCDSDSSNSSEYLIILTYWVTGARTAALMVRRVAGCKPGRTDG